MTNNDLKALVLSVFSLFGFYNALSAISFLSDPGGKAELFLILGSRRNAYWR